MKLVVGLGNPGAKYAGTRHNVGFDVVDLLAARHGISLLAEKFHAWFGQLEVGGERAVLLKPTTFMNLSGQAVAAAARFFQLPAADWLVISDDLALPVGSLRMRAGGSSGGHQGLQSVIDRVGADDWARLRIGIGAAIGDPAHYVLDRFDPDEDLTIRRVCERAADAVECWIEHGADLTMTRFNGEMP